MITILFPVSLIPGNNPDTEKNKWWVDERIPIEDSKMKEAMAKKRVYLIFHRLIKSCS